MKIGVPTEIKDHEYRVSLLPSGVETLKNDGHTVLVQKGAGEGSGFFDEEYVEAGAQILQTAEEVFGQSDMIVKVKEPLASEYPLLRKGQDVFTFFHFAASEELTKNCLERGVTAIAYETIRLPNGEHPLLTPMSEIAGRMSVQVGAKCLERPAGGRGILLGGVPGVAPGRVIILGGGVVGTNAAKMAAGLGAEVIIFDVNLARLRYLEDILPRNVRLIMSNPKHIREYIVHTDLVIGAVLIAGAKAPTLVNREMISTMQPGSVIVDVAVDQGGCVETGRPTTHSNPTYLVDGVVHYCVANMPGAVSRTSTYALTNATFPYLRRIAAQGWQKAAKEDPAIAHGINMHDGNVTNEAVAQTFNLKYQEVG